MGGLLPVFERASRLPRWKETMETAWDAIGWDGMNAQFNECSRTYKLWMRARTKVSWSRSGFHRESVAIDEVR
jgi:hypothetical protein